MLKSFILNEYLWFWHYSSSAQQLRQRTQIFGRPPRENALSKFHLRGMITTCRDVYFRTLGYFELCCRCCDPFLKLDDAVSEDHFTKHRNPLSHTANSPIWCRLQFLCEVIGFGKLWFDDTILHFKRSTSSFSLKKSTCSDKTIFPLKRLSLDRDTQFSVSLRPASTSQNWFLGHWSQPLFYLFSV